MVNYRRTMKKTLRQLENLVYREESGKKFFNFVSRLKPWNSFCRQFQFILVQGQWACKESLKMLIQIIRRHFSKNFIFYVVKCQSDAIILILQIKNAHNSYGKKKFIYFCSWKKFNFSSSLRIATNFLKKSIW